MSNLIYLIAILAAFFVFASSIKIFAWQRMIFNTQMEMMTNYGLTREQFRLIGCLELIGAIAIWFSGSIVGVVGAGLLAGVSLGALFFHFKYDTWQQGIPAMVTLTLSSILGLMQIDVLFAFLGW